MSRRVILVDLYWTREKDPRVPLGHASLLATLRERQVVEVRSIVVAVNARRCEPDRLLHDILNAAGEEASSDVDVAIGAYVWGEELLRRTLSGLRAAGFRGRIILGGPQISYSAASLEQLYPEADAFIRGYGEAALAAICETSERVAFAGVHWAGTADVVGQAAVDLEKLPSPWLTGAIPLSNQGFIRWETQRGCPFRCSFCQHREPGARLLRRSLALQRIEAEIELFCAARVQEIAVLDPIFNMAPHACGILERFADRSFSGHLSLQCRAEAIDDAFVSAAASLDVTLEFGLQTIHADEGRVIERRNQMERVDVALAAVRAHGIRHEVSLIFGLPLQTLASFEASVAWCLKREVPVIKAFPLMLLRGTALEQQRRIWSLSESDDVMPMVIRSNTFDTSDWLEMSRLAAALRKTEGRHPRTLQELQRVAREVEPDRFNWTPPRLA